MFRSFSIRLKLVILLSLSATVALLISSTITLLSTYLNQRDESLRLLTQLAEVSSDNLRAALAFQDPQSAQRLLQPLQTNPHIQLAQIEDEQGQVFGQYSAAGITEAGQLRYMGYLRQTLASLATQTSASPGAIESLGWDYIAVVRPIVFDNHQIGKFVIISDNAALFDKIRHHLLFQALLSLATLSLIVLISIPLQRLFTRPIYELLAAMQHISKTKNYQMRFSSQHNDEFKQLMDGFNLMLTDIHQRDERLSQQATTDALTGLANRRCAMDTLATLVSRAVRRAEPLGVIMLDVDFFKKINDLYGHPAGDAVLQELARLLGACARNVDLLARLGGEEFLIVCDNSNTSSTVQVAERVRLLVENHVFHYGQLEIKTSVSLGIYASIPDADSGDAMIQRADEALYRAKNSGRNRTEIWETQ